MGLTGPGRRWPMRPGFVMLWFISVRVVGNEGKMLNKRCLTKVNERKIKSSTRKNKKSEKKYNVRNFVLRKRNLQNESSRESFLESKRRKSSSTFLNNSFMKVKDGAMIKN